MVPATLEVIYLHSVGPCRRTLLVGAMAKFDSESPAMVPIVNGSEPNWLIT